MEYYAINIIFSAYIFYTLVQPKSYSWIEYASQPNSINAALYYLFDYDTTSVCIATEMKIQYSVDYKVGYISYNKLESKSIIDSASYLEVHSEFSFYTFF